MNSQVSIATLCPLISTDVALDVTVNTYIWSVIQPSTSIIAACLPTYAPLFKEESGLKALVYSAMSMISLRSRRGNSTKQSDPREVYGSNGKVSRIIGGSEEFTR